MDRQRLLQNFNANPPIDASAIRLFEKQAGFCLPDGYVQFLQLANGGEGFIGPNAYVILWRLEELLEMNEAYQVAEYAPGLFLFGSDGGGEAFAFDRRSDTLAIVSVPFVGMDLSLIRGVVLDFPTFLEELYKV